MLSTSSSAKLEKVGRELGGWEREFSHHVKRQSTFNNNFFEKAEVEIINSLQVTDSASVWDEAGWARVLENNEN